MGKRLNYRRRDKKPEHCLTDWYGNYLVWDKQSGLLLAAGPVATPSDRALRVSIYERQYLETGRLDYAACLEEIRCHG